MERNLEAIIVMLIISALGIIAYYIVQLIYKKDEIVFEVDDKYVNLNELRMATITYLRNEGKKCSLIDEITLIVNGEKYIFTERTVKINSRERQQIVLKRCK